MNGDLKIEFLLFFLHQKCFAFIVLVSFSESYPMFHPRKNL